MNVDLKKCLMFEISIMQGGAIITSTLACRPSKQSTALTLVDKLEVSRRREGGRMGGWSLGRHD